MTGRTGGSSGQILDQIAPANAAQKELVEMWRVWHLNDIHAGTVQQEKALKDGNIRGYYREQVAYLESVGLAVVEYRGKKYRYGEGWLSRRLPPRFIGKVDALCDAVEAGERERVKGLPGKSWASIGDNKHIALALLLGLTATEAAADIERASDTLYSHGGTQYIVATDDEADRLATGQLTDDPELWEQAVAARSTQEGLKEWAENVIRVDGRGPVLSSYDGEEAEQIVDNVTYFIYRQ